MRTADCHPDRPYTAKGLCNSCYQKQHYALNFHKRKAQSEAWRRDNREKMRAYSQTYHRKNYFGRTYGLSHSEVECLFRSQDFKCAICSNPVDKKTGNVDHCHETGKIRGILCRGCNCMLGNSKDNPETLRIGAEYLTKSKTSC